MTNERPEPQPEIIPPGAQRGTARMRVVVDTRSIGKTPPLAIILVILITGLLSAIMLVFLLGAFLVALPVIVLFVTAAIIVGLLRIYFQR
ncbi:MAG TPA: hypothetical protein VEC94_17220 [Pseudolabrys sp.]|nr:hypothetical protein [Pseudolabrys sp.]